MPLPRYVKGGCCADPVHVTNLTEPDFENELNTDLEMVEDLLLAWAQNHANGQTLIHFRAAADDPAASLSKLKIGGADFWPDSGPVHCIPAVYTAIAKAVMTAQEELSDVESIEPTKKRPRLESVVVMKEPGALSKPAPAPRPQRWSSGLLPSRPPRSGSEANRGGKTSWPPTRGGGHWRGPQRGGRWPRHRGDRFH
jgi:hypothetical protein